jgi:aryl-alcohol dehydrogenase-like predicted oxidoreductase
MEYRKLGNSDLNISVVGLGCWVMGKEMWAGADDSESIAAIHAAIDLGINWVDTAEGYGDGHSESVVGQALADRRDKMLIATKVSPHKLHREGVLSACEASLERLQTDHIDLYQIHWPSGSGVPIEETMGTLVELQEQGKISVIGCSNFDPAQMEDARKYGKLESLQPPWSLFWRHVEKEIVPFCIERNIGVVAYSPMAQGLLTGKYTPDNRPPADDHRNHSLLFNGETFEHALAAVARIREIGASYGKKPGQTALRWLIQQPGLTAAIVGARRPSQVEENVGAADWALSDADLAELSRLGDDVMSTLPDDSPVMWR